MQAHYRKNSNADMQKTVISLPDKNNNFKPQIHAYLKLITMYAYLLAHVVTLRWLIQHVLLFKLYFFFFFCLTIHGLLMTYLNIKYDSFTNLLMAGY